MTFRQWREWRDVHATLRGSRRVILLFLPLFPFFFFSLSSGQLADAPMRRCADARETTREIRSYLDALYTHSLYTARFLLFSVSRNSMTTMASMAMAMSVAVNGDAVYVIHAFHVIHELPRLADPRVSLLVEDFFVIDIDIADHLRLEMTLAGSRG